MKKTLLFLVLACFVLPAFSFASDEKAMENYTRSLDSLKKKDLLSALYFLDQALAQRDTPTFELKSKDGKSIDYIPYFKMGMVYYEMGKWSLSLMSFEVSEKYGFIKKRPMLYNELKKFKLFVNNKLILQVSKPKPELPEKEKVKLKARKKYMSDEYEITTGETPSLTEDSREYRLIYALRKELGLPIEPIGIYPWYFYYERALKYIEEGQWLDALVYLSESLLRKPVPKENARRYGVWFEDYSPYLHLAYAAKQRNNNTIAAEAFKIAKKYGVINASGTIFKELTLTIK